MKKEDLIGFFNQNARFRSKWLKKNYYYNNSINRFLKFLIEPKAKVLEIGCGTGQLLDAMDPREGVGIDFSSEMINLASKQFERLRFITADAHGFDLGETFDYIIISDTIGYFNDIQQVLGNIRKNCRKDTRVIVTYYNFLWEPILKLAELLGFKMKQPFTSWLSKRDIENLFLLEDYDVVKTGELMLVPKNIPVLSTLCNRYLARLPFFRKCCLVDYLVARPLKIEPTRDYSCSVVIPARNEAGNIENALKRMPRLGSHTEVVFVEGGSTDNTSDEIKRVAEAYSNDWDIKYCIQPGKGKGDAVRKGFDACSGDILMILDADLTVQPEDLVKFYNAIATEKGEFINGSRLVYPMEKESMRTLNFFGNKTFSLIFTWLLG